MKHAPRQPSRQTHGGAVRRTAFSLVELMMAIVILGLGLVMVATMFPVAWGRARDLGEFTQQRSITPVADNMARTLLHSPGPFVPTAPDVIGISFAGDLIYSTQLNAALANVANWPSDTWVHALNMENIRVEDPAFVAEDPWLLERALNLNDPGFNIDPNVIETSYWNPQIRAYQRLHPPLPQRRNISENFPLRNFPADVTAAFSEDDDNWDNRVASRRFVWAIFHQQKRPLVATAQDAASVRVFDMFYVTLRRPQPTNRYARQNNDPANLPNPYDITIPPIVPEAMGPDQDVMFPVAWRVQVEFPATLVPQFIGGVNTATNIPTVVQVPPEGFSGSESAKRMLVTMFPSGTQFIDEITGQVYRVTRVRVLEPLGDKTFLTLDREVFFEDLNLVQNDPRCAGVCAPNVLEMEERVRTVWVYPPPVQEREAGDTYPVFSGSTPVVNIEVQTMTVTPDRPDGA